MLEQAIACCMYAPGSYDRILAGLTIDGPLGDIRDALLATRDTRRGELDAHTIVRWIHQHAPGGMTPEHTSALGLLTRTWWDMPRPIRERARELTKQNAESL